MPQAIWNGKVVAQSDQTKIIDGNHYFPPDSIDRDFFRDNPTTTVCGWKGTASYYDLVVDGEVNAGSAWYYPDPKSEAAEILGYVAFWKGVEVVD